MNDISKCASESTSLHTRMAKWDLQWSTDWREIWSEQYVSKWRSLFNAPGRVGPPSPFYHPSVVQAWLDASGGERAFRPFFLTARSDDGIAVFLPLACRVTGWRQGYVRRLRPAGDHLFDYHDPIVVKESDVSKFNSRFWTEVVRALKPREGAWFDDFQLPRVRDFWIDESTTWLLADKAPFVRLADYASFDDYLRSRTGSLRGDVKRQMRRLGSLGEVSYQTYDASTLEQALNWSERLEAERGRKYPGARLPEGYLHSLIRRCTGNEPVHCSALLLNGRDISWHVGFHAQNAMFWYVPMYDPAYAEYSPGKVHLYMALRAAFEEKTSTFDFLRGQENYKTGWTNGEESRMHGLSFDRTTSSSHIRHFSARALNKLGYVASWLRRMSR